MIIGLENIDNGLKDLDTRYNDALKNSKLNVQDFVTKDLPIELK